MHIVTLAAAISLQQRPARRRRRTNGMLAVQLEHEVDRSSTNTSDKFAQHGSLTADAPDQAA
eukprot:6178384-Pleurochrysis_carterae.AAC.4